RRVGGRGLLRGVARCPRIDCRRGRHPAGRWAWEGTEPAAEQPRGREMTETKVAQRSTGFIARHELWDDEQRDAAERVAAEVAERDLRQVRIAWGDQHGIVRGKTLTVPEF